ncbi:MAG: transcription-repair coupling factor [Armatimonadota bacterium]|nr:transcription-repair coupling factor [Armatimonadota bacterium]MDW8026010.1 transcription-repair coupling factor [Armatimonadota bacterium]
MRHLLERILKHRGFEQIIEALNSGVKWLLVEGVRVCGWSVIIAALGLKLRRTILAITSTQQHSDRLYEDVKVLWSKADEVIESHPRLYRFPSLGNSVIGRDPDEVSSRERLASLLAMMERSDCVIISPIDALIYPTASKDAIKRCNISLRRGSSISMDELLERLANGGYRHSTEVQLPGEFSKRGGIIDVFTPSHELPLRIEFFGEEIESIREFDPQTQRSIRQIEKANIAPAHELSLPCDRSSIASAIFKAAERQAEMLRSAGKQEAAKALIEQAKLDAERIMRGETFEGASWYSLFSDEPLQYLTDHLPDSAIILWFEPRDCMVSCEQTVARLNELLNDLASTADVLLPPRSPWIDFSELWKRCERFSNILCSVAHEHEEFNLGELALTQHHRKVNGSLSCSLIPIHHVESFAGQLRAFIGRVLEWLDSGFAVVIASKYCERIVEMLDQFSSDMRRHIPWAKLSSYERLPNGIVSLVKATFSCGFLFQEASLVVLTDSELFGYPPVRRARKRFKYAMPIASPNELKAGEYVVHIQHGIGIFRGIVRQRILGSEGDYLLIEYAGGSMLYVPVSQIDRVQRYVGADGAEPALSSLTGTRWVRLRQRAKRGADSLARELIELKAIREAGEGFAFSEDSLWQIEMESAFPYEETEDQLRAIEEVKRDMMSPKPMDRLICGDVGFGKTEVAIRAAFKAVQDGKQVAVLVPTTVLAQQHFNTFKQRLAPYPVKIAMLSRFLPQHEQKRVIEGLRVGSIDIVIGTHRLLSDDVIFRDLGLLIIDEEQRFGVWQKEKLKKLKATVDILMLSATPIPRTLHIALSGLADISTINSPPLGRRPVRTFLMQYDEGIVRQAILRELERGGQVYYVYNRVDGINHVAEKVKRLVPQARVAVAHGQLPEERLEKVMMDFYQNKYDVLVCTTIIENGLDVPNANTLIVEGCERFGLAQLYQLRGRVGRSDRQAYAYFFHEHPRRLSEAARKRLEALREFTDLGSGLRLALRDLEIRGAGNLLGPEQHGFINDVGFDLYMQMLSEAVSRLKGEVRQERVRLPEADLPIRAFIPESYIPDEMQRLSIYRKMAAVQTIEDVNAIEAELTDRFGCMQTEVCNLLSILRIRVKARSARVAYITHDGRNVIVKFYGVRKLSDSAFARIYAKLREQFSAATLNSVTLQRDHFTIEYGMLTEQTMLKLVEGLLEALAEYPPTLLQA